MKYLLLLLCVTISFAQQITITGPATVRPGNKIDLVISQTSSASSAMQWTINSPTGWPTFTAEAVAEAITAQKQMYFSPSNGICLLMGMNINVIKSGAVGKISYDLPATMTPGAASFSLSGVIAATPQGDTTPLSVGPDYAVTVLAKQDINGDTKIDVVDVTQAIDQALGKSTCTNDQNGDGVCNLLDVMLILKQALGGI